VNKWAAAFIDCLLLLLLVMVIVPHRPDVSRETPQVDIFSKVIIGARWPDSMTADVDLWVRAPGDTTVGYSRTRGNIASLAWDDVGNVSAPPWRYEVVLVRQGADGEYVVNLHCYRCPTMILPVPVKVVVWRRTPQGESEIWSGDIKLVAEGQELTVVRFELRNGDLIPGSIHQRPMQLRAARSP